MDQSARVVVLVDAEEETRIPRHFGGVILNIVWEPNPIVDGYVVFLQDGVTRKVGEDDGG